MGRKRFGLKIAGVVGLVLVAALVASEVSRGYLKSAAAERFRNEQGFYTPPFAVGDPAPDFTLPDAAGRRHSLSSLVRQDTLLCFLCGCAYCRTMQIYLKEMLDSLGDRAPKVVSVTTAPPEAEAAWRRDTELEQVMLYETKASGKPVTSEYRGDPCPRLFRMDAGRRLTWIGPSPAQVKNLDALGEAIARNLGYRIPTAVGGGGRAALPGED